jgi:hypothetical protein
MDGALSDPPVDATAPMARNRTGDVGRKSRWGRCQSPASPSCAKYEFEEGKPVFLLHSPDGVTFVMQTYTNHIDPELRKTDLPDLRQRLKLPDGWEFKAKTLDRTLVLDTKGLAHIVPDDLENMYQGVTEDVRNYDPWN